MRSPWGCLEARHTTTGKAAERPSAAMAVPAEVRSRRSGCWRSLQPAFFKRTLPRFEQPGEPVQDVQGHLAVVDARRRSCPNFSIDPGDLGRELGGLAQDDDPPLAEAEGQALGAAGGRDFVLPSSNEWSTAVSASLRIGTLPSGPLSDVPVKVWTLLTRSESSRPRVIGWSPRRWFWRLKTRHDSPLLGVRRVGDGPCAHAHAEPLGQALGGRAHRGVVGDEQQGAALLDPVADGVALGVGERRIRRLGLAHALGPQRVGDDQDVALLERSRGRTSPCWG